MNAYDVLGQHVIGEDEAERTAFNLLGAGFGSESGFNADFLINAASEVTKRGVATYQESEAAKKSAAEIEAQTQQTIAADRAWANAEVELELAQQAKSPARVSAAQALVSSASSEAMSAGIGLPPAAVKKRAAAINEGIKLAANAVLSDPKNTTRQAYVRAWRKIASEVAAASVSSSGGGGAKFGGGGAGNFLTKMAGPLPVWGWGVAAVAALAGVVLIAKMRK